MFFIALTGVLLHLDMMRVGHSPPGHEPPRREIIHPLPADGELAAMVARIADAARDQHRVPVHVIRIDLAGPRITLSASAGGPPGDPELKLDAVTGKPIADPPPVKDYHEVLQDLHAGYFLGWTGRIISILCGVALIVLSITGVQIWWDLRRRRRTASWWWR